MTYLVVVVVELAVVDPARDGAEDGLRHERQRVLDHRAHVRVAVLHVRVNRRRQRSTFLTYNAQQTRVLQSSLCVIIHLHIAKLKFT